MCIEYRIQHRNATVKKLELERELTAVRLRYDMLYNQVTTQGAAATARAAETGEDAFRLPNGELMTADKFMERTRMLTQTRTSLDRSEANLTKTLDEMKTIRAEKETAVNECRRFESLLTRFEQSRRYDVFTNDTYRETTEENSRLVDRVDLLEKKLGEANEEIAILKRRSQDSPDVKMTSAFLDRNGKVPGVCPVGGCSNYDSVQCVLKNFQNHMNNTHRVRFSAFFCVGVY